MVSVGFKTLVAQAVVSLVNNQGDLRKVLKDMGSQSNLRALAAAVVTAGLVGSPPTPGLDFGKNLQANVIQSGVRAGVAVVIEGQSAADALKNAGMNIIVDTVSESLATRIGMSSPHQ
jgi:filamentous hemagglutinin